MTSSPVVAALLDLDAVPRPSVRRFDSGPAFRDRIAVLPSAFNPPTSAHLRLLELAGRVDGISGRAALLSTRNVEKGVFGASLADRIGMLRALAGANPGLAVLAANVALIPDQAVALLEAYPASGFDFVVGFDTLIRIFQSRFYEDMERDLARFFANHRLIAMNRGEADFDAVCRFLEKDDVRPYAQGIVPCALDGEAATLSSTHARDRATGPGLRQFVPGEVAEYIERRGLYRPAEPGVT